MSAAGNRWRTVPGKKGLSVRHEPKCPASEADGPRCRCAPYYRGRRRNPATGKPQWSPTMRDKAEVLTWLGSTEHARNALADRSGPTLAELGDQWMDGAILPVIDGDPNSRPTVGSRGGSGKPYKPSTARGYRRDWINLLKPEYGEHVAGEISVEEWQTFVDSLSASGLMRGRVDNIMAVVSAIYEWASHPATRRRTGCRSNPIKAVRKPARDRVARTRVALPEETKKLLAALPLSHRVAYGLAFFAGLRREEIERLVWADVDMKKVGGRITVREAKSEAGTLRRLPIIPDLYVILREAYLAAEDKSPTARVSSRSLMSGKHAKQARDAWEAAGLDTIRLHECRHTYASYLMEARYPLYRMMRMLGHTDVNTTMNYVHLVGEADEDLGKLLEDYLAQKDDDAEDAADEATEAAEGEG